VGTRYEDQPVEQWAGPDSLDPTPVWKQYVLIAALLLVGLIVVVIVSITALAPQFATPPALVFGDRLVLSSSEIPAVGEPAKLISAPVVDATRAFYLAQPAKGDVVAVSVSWRPRASEPACRVASAFTPQRQPQVFVVQDCAVFVPGDAPYYFDLHGDALDTRPPRGLDRYLVSVSGDRVIVNLSRLIEPTERTSGPVPTGIPQPQTQSP
jgi:hypothetical protein